ncbi:MAG: cytochrome ubiquinol oxidase subunit I [Bacteroidales bacterium]|nr:cytochrome ubiquinol oxidase subunit I [Bacteroidales bacterium]
MDELTTTLVDWSRGQFALTAMYHWLFVPLTLGLSVIMAICETIYYRTGDQLWKRITQFWMTLFGVNFAIGIATGIILEFQFGTNWSNYSWFVGDIFGAPLAIEGLMAFFLEATFSAVMFFGWNKVSKDFHLTSTWMTSIGATLSALWILVANAWMQHPVGMKFNPETVRNEMFNFWDVIGSPVAVNKFLHTVLSSWVLGAVFVVGVSCWFLIKQRNQILALKSIKVATSVGIFAIFATILTGDDTAKVVAKVQPMKLAAMEGLYEGSTHQSIVAIGIMNPKKAFYNNEDPFLWAIRIPDMLSWLAFKHTDAFVPGINDILYGGYEAANIKGEPYIMPSIDERVMSGQAALQALTMYKDAFEGGNHEVANHYAEVIQANFSNFGYGYAKNVDQLIPPVKTTFYAFHIMVMLGFYFVLFFIVMYLTFGRQKTTQPKYKWLMWIGLLSLPLAYINSEAGWVTAEVGRQPWTIQDILPTFASISKLATGTVQTTFWMFASLFTLLLIADVWIIVKQIKKENFKESQNDSESY